jgi:PAS domain S-box-containing protein
MTSLPSDVATVLAEPAVRGLLAAPDAWWLWTSDAARLVATNAAGARAAGVAGAAAAVARCYPQDHVLAGQVARLARSLAPGSAPRLELVRLHGRVASTVALVQARRILCGDQDLVLLTMAGPTAAASRPAALAFIDELSQPAVLLDAEGAVLGGNAAAASVAPFGLEALVRPEVPSLAALGDRAVARFELASGHLTVIALGEIAAYVAFLDPRPRVEAEPAIEPDAVAPAVVDEPPAATQPAAAPAATAADAGLVPPPRFSWRLDADQRFTAIEPREVAAAAGLTLAEARVRFGLDPDGKLTAAIGGGKPFSGVPAVWPLGETRRLSVSLAAFPAPGEGSSRGFAGFGLVVSEVSPAVFAEPVSAPAAAPAPIPSNSADLGEAPLTEPVIDAVGGGPEAATQPAPEVAAPATDSPPDDAADADQIEPKETDSQGVDRLRAEGGRPQLTLHTNPPNVVALRSTAGQDMKRSATLTPGERNAFREIAKALGVRTDRDDSLDGEDNAKETAKAPHAPVPDEPVAERRRPAPVAWLVTPLEPEPEAAEPEPPAAAPEPELTPLDETTAEEPAVDEAVLTDSATQQDAAEAAAAPASPNDDDWVPPAVADAPSIAPPRVPHDVFSEAGTPFGPLPSAFGTTGKASLVPDVGGEAPPAAPPVPSPAVNPPPVINPPPAATGSPGADADMRALLDRMPLGLLIHRGNTVLLANRTLLDWTGYAGEAELEAAGGVARVFAGTESREQAGADTALAVTAADGSTIPVEARLSKFAWGGEQAFLFTLTRIETAAAAEPEAETATLTELRGRLEEVEQILDTATDGIVIVAPDGAIESMNRSAEALFGYESAEVKGRSFTTLFAPESHRSAIDYCDGLLTNGVASVLNDGRQIIGRVKQGGLIPLYMTMGRTGPRSRPKLAAVFRDMTQWKKAEEDLLAAKRQAEQASSQKSDFLAKISHEIRTPLNAIIGFSEVMMEERFGAISNERYREYLKDIHASGGHVLSLINDLLDLSKIEAGKLELAFTSVDLNDIVQSTVAIMQPQANRERVIIRSSLQGKLPNVVADARSLRQIALNLLSNSVKFTPAGGQIIVSTALSEAGEAILRVRDTGVGMSEAELKAAMEPFRQVATTSSQSVKGTGLGLPLTKALVEANRASFGISSAPNQGTLVEVVFPPTRVLAE